MTNEFMRVVEINGVKIEVDLRTAKRVDSFSIGTPVKLLKQEYSDSYSTYTGVIIGFDEFKNLPSITVAYVKAGYGDHGIEFVTINAKTEKMEIAPLQEHEYKFSFSDVVKKFDNEIEKKQTEIDQIKTKKEWFIANYKKFFSFCKDIEE